MRNDLYWKRPGTLSTTGVRREFHNKGRVDGSLSRIAALAGLGRGEGFSTYKQAAVEGEESQMPYELRKAQLGAATERSQKGKEEGWGCQLNEQASEREVLWRAPQPNGKQWVEAAHIELGLNALK